MGIGIGIGTGTGAALPFGEASPWSLLGGAVAALLLVWAAQMLEWAWLAPRRMERALRAQGLRGTQYRFLHGDLTEDLRLVTAARSKPVPMDRPHDIIPRIAPLLHRALEEHGRISFTWFGPMPRVTITDPELVREVLSNKFGHFEKTRLTTQLSKLLIGGLVILHGEKWVKHRRIMNPAFHAEKLKRMLPAFSASCSELIGRWENAVATSVGKAALDIWPDFQNLSGDVISRAAFGVRHQEGRKIFLLQAEQAERLVQSFRSNYIPGLSLLPTENNRRMKAIDREIKSILRGIIEKRQKAMKNGEASKDDLLGLLLESNMDYYSDEDGKSSKGMAVEEIIEECKLFYFAGMETTAVLLTWTMVVLSMHPEWQDRAREEILQVTMVLYEVLRLYPPVVMMNRRTYKEIELGGVRYPAGVMLSLPVLFIHRDAAVWGHDAGEFNPGRFAEGVARACKDPGAGAFFPFSWGPRICIGQNFALLEAKVALSMILQRFTFELSPAYVHAPYTVLTLHPQHGVPVKLHRL
uniref:Cytochrome P450 n=1 Tax=Oryza punctata TaxID=4537 RepID=A0A0E0JLE5_ORYPU